MRSVGKHNKTERRYRQKVQAAQSDLRDAVPALRVLYGTSTDEQKQSTDFRAADGTVDGLGEFNRPNASAKTTIFLGARMYIELLQDRVNILQRKVEELEAFRAAVAGQDNLRQWREDFEGREAVRQAALQAVKREEESSDDEEESEEEAPKRKKPRATKSKKSTDVRAFAAFAISFAFLPSATSLFPSTAQNEILGHVYQPATTTQILRRLPMITAAHISRLLARALPVAIAPTPSTLFDWTWRLLLAYSFTLVLRYMSRHWNQTQEYPVPVGKSSIFVKDAFRAMMPRKQIASADCAAWTKLASQVVGGGKFAFVYYNEREVDISLVRFQSESLSSSSALGNLSKGCSIVGAPCSAAADNASTSIFGGCLVCSEVCYHDGNARASPSSSRSSF